MTENLAEIFQKLSPEEREYFLAGLLENLEFDGDAEKVCRILSDYDFIYSKMKRFGTESLIKDYNLRYSPKLNLDVDVKNNLRLIQSALRLSENIIIKDRNQLASQLWGRLPHEDYPVVLKLLEDTKNRCKRPWLRPITPSLINAGGPLIRILEGHTSVITSLAVYRNKLFSGSWDKTIRVWDAEIGRAHV